MTSLDSIDDAIKAIKDEEAGENENIFTLGVDAFAALGACDWLVWSILWAVQALAQGFSSLIAFMRGVFLTIPFVRVTHSQAEV